MTREGKESLWWRLRNPKGQAWAKATIRGELEFQLVRINLNKVRRARINRSYQNRLQQPVGAALCKAHHLKLAGS